MNKTLIALAISATLTTNAALAATDANEQIVITASRTAQQQFDVLAPVNVFDRADIERINPESLSDLLVRVAGINTSNTGTAANNTSMFIRGGNSDHMLLLIDGVRVGSATLGQKNLGDIPMQMIDRVEVIRGPRASLWGSDAIGGVVQIFTRKLTTGQADLSVSIGSDALRELNGAVGLGGEEHSYTLAMSTARADGFDVLNPDPYEQDDKDGYKRHSVSLNGVSQWSATYSSVLSAQLDKGDTEFDSGFGGDEQSYDNHFVQLSNDFSFEQTRVSFKLASALDKNHDNSAQLFQDASNAFFETKRKQFNIVGEHDFERFHISGGFDWYKEQVASSTLYSENERVARALYLVGRTEFDSVKLEGSVRKDEVGQTKAQTTHQWAVGYQAADNLLLSYSQGTAFKAPTFNDLYWPDSWGSIGNPALKSELADNKELLVRYLGEVFTAEVSLYQTDYDNLIEWQYDVDTAYSTPTNVDKAKVKGAEVTVQFAIGQLSNQLSLSHIDAKNGSSGEQLLRRPIFSGFYTATYDADGYDLIFELNHQGKRNDTGGSLPSHTIANIGLSMALSDNLDLHAKVKNLTDKDYVQTVSWPDAQTAAYPGNDRNYVLSLNYRF